MSGTGGDSKSTAPPVPTADGWTPSPLQLERIAYRRKRDLRSILIARGSTAVVIAALVLSITNTQGWPRFRENFFDLSYGWQVLPDILEGLWLNLRQKV
jgi:polar amino acid transport system permease protein